MTGYNKVFLDTTPLIYFLDADENFGDKTRQIFEEILSGAGTIVTSVVTPGRIFGIPISHRESRETDCFP